MPLGAIELKALSSLLDEALALTSSAREAWFAALPGDALKPLLAEMLAAQASGQSDRHLSTLPRLGVDEPPLQAGARVGPYRLLREIGRGGMGSVWLAARADGSFERDIALKLPHLSWMDGLAARMARERRIGALLEHPNIARMYDAGVDEKGLPFIAMQFVDGQPIDAYCEARSLDIPARLRLFVQVVRAVAYAHGRLVIHRDLKPANVLVDARGQAHLLDFGIAKLADDVAHGMDLTQEGARALTPSYAAPEQIAGQPIGVTADVYSLGVLLYQLLSGSMPYALKRPTLGAMENAILQGDAPPASERAVDPRLARSLRGELDALLGKAMKREPTQRYASAEALADDIERYLAGKTVSARPDGLGYRIRKGVARHRLAVVASAAVLVAVLLGGGSTLLQRRSAAQSAERARLATEFVSEVFRVSARAETALPPEGTRGPAESVLDQAAKLIVERFPGQPDMQAELYGVLGRIYADMGASQAALQYGKRQMGLLDGLRVDPARRARALILLANASAQDDQDVDAETYAAQATQAVPDDEATWVEAQTVLAEVLFRKFKRQSAFDVASRAEQVLVRRGETETAAMARLLYLKAQAADDFWGRSRAFQMALKADGPRSPITIDLAIKLAIEAAAHGHVDQAQRTAAFVLDTLRSRGGTDAIRAAVFEAEYFKYMNTANSVRRVTAIAAIERSRSDIAASSPWVPPVVLARLDLYLAELKFEWGDLDQAQRLLAHSAPVLLATVQSAAFRLEVVTTQAILAMATGRHEAAERLFDQTLTMFHQDNSAASDWYAFRLRVVALNLTMSANYERAQALLSAAPPYGRRAGSPLGESIPRLIPNELARLALARGDAGGAMKLLPALPSNVGSDTDPWYPERALHGEIDCALGRSAEGLPALLESIRTLSPLVSDHEPNLARLRATAGLCALARGQRPLALQMAAASRAAFAVQPGVSPYFKLPLAKLERGLGAGAPAR